MRSMVFLVVLLAACTSRESKTVGSIERIDAGLDKLISSSATLEIIGEGFEWSEGPVWVGKENMLLFSDVPKNIIYKWTEEKGVEPYLTPSGFTGTETTSHEPGSNGLIIHNDSLVLCQHGDRRIAKMNSSLDNPTPNFSTVSSTYEGKRFSSPNDAVYRSNGDLYLTDPPYGLGQQNDDPEKEQPHNGVYRVSPRGDVSLLIDSLTLPNGIIFLPGEKKFIVSNSDPAKAIWYEFELNDKDSVQQGRVFYNATSNAGTEKGLPDGLKADRDGNIFASGPGGIWIFNPAGTVLGKIKTPEAVANCALSPDEKTLYITSDMYLLRLKMRD
ncbi:MAG: SMP-30/gluconolactonase/LRE family protein [Cyclobacteriaceae bacterium]|nr:SMP-30/gluconolactonase/LRE family protein [Cyclobacteriaceae bacterium]